MDNARIIHAMECPKKKGSKSKIDEVYESARQRPFGKAPREPSDLDRSAGARIVASGCTVDLPDAIT
jgi:hypothetical protein